MSRAVCLTAVLTAAGLLGACHAHGDKAVTMTDHGVTASFTRAMNAPSTVNVTFRNASAKAVCLSPVAFTQESFSIKTDKGDIKSVTPPATPTSDCDALAAGAEKTQAVNLGGFSRLNEQTGKVCYHYAFTDSPAAGAAWRATGVICE